MSRLLPRRPNLEHLKHQARQRLREMQLSNPSVRLSDAQHAIAREYGFASWPKLKAHVETLSPDDSPAADAQSSDAGDGNRQDLVRPGPALPPGDGQFSRYSHRARQAVFFARLEAGAANATTIETEHVLLGLMRAAQDTRGRIFDRVALSLDEVRTLLKPQRAPADPSERPAHVLFSATAMRALRNAAAEADDLGHKDIRIVHLLLGVLMESESAAALFLTRRGVLREALREGIDALLSEDPI